ncbi:MAG TPA: DUF1653 domain-containing protein [Candidatus Paceibacterota bacterium]|nr:DUF1653 domain-containing protein [Candidatus Paceibacterota bacterium]
MSQVTNEKLKPGQLYRHYKGNHYKILVLGKHSETGEELVAYERQEDGHVYFRPISMFFETVEWEGKTVPRFTLISDN